MNPAVIHDTSIQIGGLTPLTSIDYPGELSAVIFCQGCPYRCSYCHNSELISRKKDTGFVWSKILKGLSKRAGLLDAVVFSGGEPTLQKNLPAAIKDVKKLGFKVGLHTAGCYPQRLEKLLPMLDWVGLDIKATAVDYESITQVPGSGVKAWKSLDILSHSTIDFEVRITIHKTLLPQSNLMQLLKQLSSYRIPAIAIQQCDQTNMLDETCKQDNDDWLDSVCIDFARQRFDNVLIRSLH